MEGEAGLAYRAVSETVFSCGAEARRGLKTRPLKVCAPGAQTQWTGLNAKMHLVLKGTGIDLPR